MFVCSNCHSRKLTSRYMEKMPYLWCGKCHSIAIMGGVLKKLLTLKNSTRTSLKRKCPSCKNLFKLFNYRNKSGDIIELDFCSRCHLLWLDKSEINSVKSIRPSHYKSENFDIEGEVFHFTDTYKYKNLDQFIFDHAKIDVIKHKKITDIPFYTFTFFLLILVVYKSPHYWDRLLFDPKGPTLLSFFGSSFLHQDKWHLISNSYFFLQFSTVLERYIGHKQYLKLIFMIIIISQIVYYFFGPNIPILGLSDVIFGIMGSLACLLPYARLTFFMNYPSWKLIELISLKVRLPVSYYMFFFFCIELFYFHSRSGHNGVSYLSHIVGFITGYLLSSLFIQMKKVS